jgi:lipopolysaccharide export system protein LptA
MRYELFRPNIPGIAVFIFCISFIASGQKQNSGAKAENTTIHILHAGTLQYDLNKEGGAERLIGNVGLEDDSITMFCDSAYVFRETNAFNAYGHVHLTKKDTVDLYGDSLHYKSKTKMAEMFGSIKCLNKATVLTTHHLLYSIKTSSVNYWDGGTIVDSNNTLVSRTGIYELKQKMCVFKDSVVLTNPQYILICDTMNYSPEVRKAYFFSPTHIKSKSNSMYCERGYYDTRNNISQFWKNPYIISKKGERLKGDQLIMTETGISGKC